MSDKLTAIDLSYALKRHPVWDDMRMAAAADKLFSPAGRITFDYANHGLSFAVNTIYPNDYVIFMTQMSHMYDEGSDIELHVHWDQALNALPNWIVEYRFVNIGVVFPALSAPAVLNNNVAAFIANVHQVTDGVTQSGVGLTISHDIEVRLYRDTTNVTGLFAGADPYGAAVLVKEFDCHYQRNALGSWAEFLKWG